MTRKGWYSPGTLEERFWRKVQKTDGCWIWLGMRHLTGYGMIQSGRKGSRVLQAHRLSWELHHGPIPDGLYVCHHCDNPACVRPDHLFLGTAKDNFEDSVRKFRRPRAPFPPGERNPSAILTDAQVSEIRRLYDSGKVLQKTLMREFGISRTHVSAIICNKTRVGSREDLYYHSSSVKGESNKFAKLTDAQIAQIRNMYTASKIPQRELANQFGVSHQHISRIVHWRTRKD